ncbi:hypothetical protein HYALB_00011295 [Hymenoscyphus albidus]|uniref:Carrier domain-containing protein n=1 Tax=Hymenoscyphus albidus TaxID=595503 RepID=A0A9N9LHZ4_9HELO|nr:hypothetical protein HYALB_00011295 [Hymenoscyphus albidus]
MGTQGLDQFHERASYHQKERFMEILKNTFVFDAVVERIRRTNPQGKLYAEVISKLEHIVRGDIDMLALLFNGTLAQEFYADVNESAQWYKEDLPFAEGIKRMTNDQDVYAIINSLSGDGLIATWEYIKAYGRLVEIGKNDISKHKNLPMFQFSKNVTFSAIDYAAMIAQRLVVVGKILDKVFELFTAGKMTTTLPVTRYRISEVDSAFRSIKSGNTTGKMVTEVGDDDIVQVRLKSNPSRLFSADASHVISGGLGGLGRSMASWMVLRGAMNLILLFRSGLTTREAQLLLVELENHSVRVVSPACDITDASALKDCITECALSMPPILGCIQASMVIKKSIAIDLGVVATTGWLKLEENKHLMDCWLSSSIYPPLTLPQVLAVLEHYCDPNLPLQTRDACEVVVGVEIPADLKTKEIEKGIWMSRPLCRGMAQIPCSLSPSSETLPLDSKSGENSDPSALFAAASTPSLAASIVTSALCTKLAKSLSFSKGAEEIDTNKPLNNYRVDSLLAVDLRAWLLGKFKADITVFEILAGG